MFSAWTSPLELGWYNPDPEVGRAQLPRLAKMKKSTGVSSHLRLVTALLFVFGAIPLSTKMITDTALAAQKNDAEQMKAVEGCQTESGTAHAAKECEAKARGE